MSVAVMPFAGRDSAEEWLSKGLADLLARGLAESPSVVVVEREHLQSLLEEMELGQAPLFDQKQALRAGRLAEVSYVVYGSFAIKGSRLEIEAVVLDLASQKIVASEETAGPLEKLSALSRDLAGRVARSLGSTGAAKVRHSVSDSLPALEHFYRGLDAYDRGELQDALASFIAALKQDPAYHDASLWIGRSFEAQGWYEHAVISYRDLFKKAPQSIEALDALLFAARLLRDRLHSLDRAIVHWKTVRGLAPASPHALEAAFHLGDAQEALGHIDSAYAAFLFIEKFRERSGDATDFRSRHPGSRFTTWDRVLKLGPEASVRSVLLYDRFLREREVVPAPRGVITVSTGTPVFGEERYGAVPALFEGKKYDGWRQRLFVFVAPAGMEATAADLQISGRIHAKSPNHDYTLRLLPFPLPQQPLNRWLGAIYGQTSEFKTLRKRISFHGQARRIFAVELLEIRGEIKDWRVQVELRPITQKVASPQARTERPDFFEGQVTARLPLSSSTVTAASRPADETWVRPERVLSLKNLPGERQALVVVQGALDGDATDLYYAEGTGARWSAFERLPINGAAEDYDPRLTLGEDGKLRLAWLSNRRGRGWEIWTTIRDGGSWSAPFRLAVERIVDSGMESLAATPARLLEFDLAQDRRGRWLLAYSSPATRELVIARSRDFKSWELLGRLTNTDLTGISIAEDDGGRYRLAGITTDGTLTVFIDGKGWSLTSLVKGLQTGAGYRSQWIPEEDGRMTLLFSDRMTGLQYLRPPTTQPDLVIRADLQAWSAAPRRDGRVTLALYDGDAVTLRRYERFQPDGEDVENDTPNWAIYVEKEKDAEGNQWQRIFARQQIRIPDVTALAIDPRDDRIWWGIETGMMNLKGQQFYATDVSLGFFHHYVTDIAACSAAPVTFACRDANEPILGYADKVSGPGQYHTVRIPGAQGAIRAFGCATDGQVVAETQDGQTWIGLGQTWRRAAAPSERPSVKRQALLSQLKNPVYAGIGSLEADRNGGIWYLPDSETPSRGLAHFNGRTHRLYNPPHETLDRPSSLAVNKNGDVWIGTWFRGLYKLERKR
jgi:tetratricopeptide (TPR) repeat protein